MNVDDDVKRIIRHVVYLVDFGFLHDLTLSFKTKMTAEISSFWQLNLGSACIFYLLLFTLFQSQSSIRPSPTYPHSTTYTPDDFPASALVLYGPARPPSVAPPKRKSKFKRDELPEPIPSDPESLQALALHLKETKLFDTDAACKSFATNMFILVRALSPENNALFKKRFPAFVQAIQDPNFKSILRDELFRPEPFFVVLADID
jgi:hypothetical protein